jgi:hypothetical protein
VTCLLMSLHVKSSLHDLFENVRRNKIAISFF